MGGGVRGKGTGMPGDDLAAAAEALTSPSFDRPTLLLGAAAPAATARGSGPAPAPRRTRVWAPPPPAPPAGARGRGHAAGRPTSIVARSGPRFDPHLARRLQHVLRDVLRDPSIHSPGVILHVHSSKLGRWTGVAGL